MGCSESNTAASNRATAAKNADDGGDQAPPSASHSSPPLQQRLIEENAETREGLLSIIDSSSAVTPAAQFGTTGKTVVLEPSQSAIARARERAGITGHAFRQRMSSCNSPQAAPRAFAKVSQAASPSRRTEAILKGNSMSTSSSGGNPLQSAYSQEEDCEDDDDHDLIPMSRNSPIVAEILQLCSSESN